MMDEEQTEDSMLQAVCPADRSDENRFESLRKILEAEQCRPVPYSEAAEIGQSLIDFFYALAETIQDESSDASALVSSPAVGAF